MTRTLKTLAAIALICMSAPAFAHGSGHGGMGMGGSDRNGHSTSSNTNSMIWNKIDNTVGRHHDRHDRKIKLMTLERQERINRLRAEFRRLFALEQKELALNHTRAVELLRVRIRHVLIELKNDGGLVDAS